MDEKKVDVDTMKPIDVKAVRRDFPVLERKVHGVPLVYLDNAATSQKPVAVIEAMNRFYRHENSNVHRGIHALSEEATADYEAARKKIARFIHAKSRREIVFTRNATESINLVAYSWGVDNLHSGDEVLITEMEHHANIVPWQQVCRRTGATLRYVPITPQGYLDLSTLDDLLTEKTKLFAFTAMSNVLGTIPPVKWLVEKAHAVGALALVDGAQAVSHMPVDVLALDCDFLAFSSHKMCGPTGIGALYGKAALLNEMSPFLTGGDMILSVWMDHATWNDIPHKFEAGTPAIAEAIGFGAAVDYLNSIGGMEAIHRYEQEMVSAAMTALQQVEGLRMIGPPPADRGGLVSFVMEGLHPHDIAAVLDRDGIAVRAGHHCAQPVHDRLGIHATARASFYFYNLPDEIDLLVQSLQRAQKLFGR